MRCARALTKRVSEVALNRFHILRLALIIEVTAILVSAAAISIDFQDSWILEGLEIPFAILIATYVIYVFVETEIRWIIPFVAIFRVVFGLIPNLKYLWFQGVWPDQHTAYRLTQDIYDQNYVPSGMYYSDTPHMHLFFAIFSKETGIPILSSFKYCLILIWSIYPLVIYMMLKSCEMTKNSSLVKYALIVSSIPVEISTSYIVTGSSIGVLISLLILSEFMRLKQAKDRREWIILVIYAFTLVSAHSYSATMLTIILFAVFALMQLARRFLPKDLAHLQLKHWFMTSIIICLLNLAWLLHKATNMLNLMVGFMRGYVSRALGAELLLNEPVPPRFFGRSRMVWRDASSCLFDVNWSSACSQRNS